MFNTNKAKVTILAGMAAVAFTANARAQDDVAEQLAEQSARIDQLSAELEYMMEEDESDWFGNVDIHGFLAQGYMDSDHNNFLTQSKRGSWATNEVGLNFGVDVDEKTRAGMQFFSRDLGPLGNNEVTIDWAMVDYHLHDMLGLRFGKIKPPHGLYNETRDVDMLRNSILLPQSVYNEPFRAVMSGIWGVGLYGNVPASGFGDFDYQTQIGTLDVASDGAIARAVEDGQPLSVDRIDLDYIWSNGLRWNTPIDGLLLSATYFIMQLDTYATTTADILGPSTTGTPMVFRLEDLQYMVFSAEYTWDELVLTGEYWLGDMRRELDIAATSTPVSRDKLEREGYYASAAYRFSDWFELGSYYSVHYPNSNDKGGALWVAGGDPDFKAWLKDFALTARFDITDNWVFKLEGHKMNGAGDLLLRSDNPDGYKQDWTLFMAKLSLSF